MVGLAAKLRLWIFDVGLEGDHIFLRIIQNCLISGINTLKAVFGVRQPIGRGPMDMQETQSEVYNKKFD